MPGYLAKQSELKCKDVDAVLVFCVNDSAVMEAWGKDQGIAGSMITFLADPHSELAKGLGLELTDARVVGCLGTPRVKRCSLLVEDNEVKIVNVACADDDPAGDDRPECTFVEKMLADL